MLKPDDIALHIRLRGDQIDIALHIRLRGDQIDIALHIRLRGDQIDIALHIRLRGDQIDIALHIRLRGDQIEVFKIVNGYEDVDRNIFFKLKEGSRTRGHKAALVKEQCRLYMRKYSFSQRVIDEWNKLPNDCVNASIVNMSKNRIYRYLIRAGYT